MKKVVCALTLIAALTFGGTCAAQDIWVDYWESENVDVYMMDETLKGTVSDTACRFIYVSTKMVENGRLKKIVKWTFDRFRTDMWRYETDEMDGRHTTVVIPRNKLFEACMNKLGWQYKIVDMWYY
ncbi:MAG: hypothetical protein K6G55_00745 [Selenomonadaceae bacterium]|nr:hypothetical protein [Selenomonadaceae bacterium]